MKRLMEPSFWFVLIQKLWVNNLCVLTCFIFKTVTGSKYVSYTVYELIK